MPALPSFTVTGTILEITGNNTASVLDEVPPATLRLTFTPNLNPTTDLVSYWSKLYKIDIVYAAIKNDGTICHATMAGGELVPDNEPIVLVANDGDLSVANLQYRVQLETPNGLGWQELTSWWIDAGEDGTTVNLSEVARVVGEPATGLVRGPRAYNITDVTVNGDHDLVFTREDGFSLDPVSVPYIDTAVAAANVNAFTLGYGMAFG